MAKKLTSVFLVVDSDGIQGTYKTFNLAKEKSEELWQYEDKDSKILEVVNVWSVGLPEEPQPEVTSVALEDLE